jgi:hypothetical protein
MPVNGAQQNSNPRGSELERKAMLNTYIYDYACESVVSNSFKYCIDNL